MNKYWNFLPFLITLVFFIASCETENSKPKKAFEIDSSTVEKVFWMDTIQKPDVGEPIWGYRFVLRGDFDGDRQPDTLTEYFIDNSTGVEINKYFSNLPNTDHQYYDVKFRSVSSFLLAQDSDIDTLYTGGLGPLYIEVIGDIDGNGSDEIGIVYMDASPSNLNSYNILTYKDNKWKNIGGIPVRDFDFPPLPGYNKQYGLFGSVGEVEIKNDSVNHLIEKQLLDYKHAKLVAPKTIEVSGYGYFACDHNSIIRSNIKNEENAYWVEIGWDEKKISSNYEYHWARLNINGFLEKDRIEIYDELKEGKFDFCDQASTVLQRIKFK